MWMMDRLANLITGLGTAKDKGIASRYAFNFLNPEQLTAAYRSSWLPRKVIDIPAADMTRAWRSWQAEEDQIELIEATEKRLKLQSKVKLAKQWARLYGGAGIYIGTGDSILSDELTPERIRRDGIQYLHVMSRFELTAQDLILDPLSPYFGEPTFYSLASGNKAGVTIHPSRVVRFVGRPIPRFAAGMDRWGDSELQVLDDALKQAGVSLAQVATLFNEAKSDIISVPGLSQILATAEGTSRLTNRFAQAALMKSAHNVLLLEGGAPESAEKWETRQIDFGAFPAILQLYLKVAAGAADIPVTRLLNDSPSGMQSTGDSDTTNYYDRLSAEQNTDLTPEMERLDEMLIRSSLGSRPPEVHYRWNPLWQMSEAQKADIWLKKAQATQIYITTNAIPDEVITVAVRNQLQEDGTYPGLDAAFDDYDAKVEAGEIEPDGGDDDEPTEPPNMSGVAALLAAARGPGPHGAPLALPKPQDQTQAARAADAALLLDDFHEYQHERNKTGQFGSGTLVHVVASYHTETGNVVVHGLHAERPHAIKHQIEVLQKQRGKFDRDYGLAAFGHAEHDEGAVQTQRMLAQHGQSFAQTRTATVQGHSDGSGLHVVAEGQHGGGVAVHAVYANAADAKAHAEDISRKAWAVNGETRSEVTDREVSAARRDFNKGKPVAQQVSREQADNQTHEAFEQFVEARHPLDEVLPYPGLKQASRYLAENAAHDATGASGVVRVVHVRSAVAAPVRDARAADAAPRTLYVMRPVVNAAEILTWARKQGFSDTLSADDLHVTIAYSRAPVDWFKAYAAGASIEIPPGGARQMEQFGEATVLLIASDELQWRHSEFERIGATWDHPEYQPHITISYGGAPEDLSAVEPYQGKIVLGPERFAEVDDNWRAKLDA